jgi:CubicO group peptidase (beta-lactamase class C family)
MKYLCALVIKTILIIGCTGNDVDVKVDAIFKEFNEGTPGAAVAVYKDSEIIFAKGYGLADLKNHTKIKPETNFRLASITKQFTATSILLLAQDEKLSLKTKLIEVLPEFPNYGKDITIKHLLQHSSGLLDYESHIDDTVTTQLMDEDVLTILMKQDSLYFAPGSQYKYSNSGYALLSLIVERVSGQKFPDFLKERIFTPLGMDNSVAFINGYNRIPRRAFGYKKENSEFIFSDQSRTSAVLGDGGIYTSIVDMKIWDDALNNSALLSPEVLIESWTKGETNNNEQFDYGYGWRISEYNGEYLNYHTGGTCGFSNVYMRFPEHHLSVLVLINIGDYPAFEMGKKVADVFLSGK